MKQLVIIFSLLFVFVQKISAQADTSTVFTVAIDEKSAAYNKAGTQLSFTRMNVLYVGVENPIAISVPGVSSKDITAQISSGGTIEKQEDGSFIATVSKVGRGVIVVKAKEKEVSRHEFRAKRTLDPIPSLNGKFFGGNIETGTIKSATGIVPILKDFDYNFRFSVISFQMGIYSDGKLTKIETAGPLFSEEMKRALEKVKSGDLVFFNEIILTGTDNMRRKIEQMVFPVI